MKTERLEARLDPATRARISDAAALTGETVSAFVTRVASDEADRVLARSNALLMDEKLFDQMMATIDEPDAAPGLDKAYHRPRPFARAAENR